MLLAILCVPRDCEQRKQQTSTWNTPCIRFTGMCFVYIDNEIRWAAERRSGEEERNRNVRCSERAFISLYMVEFVLCLALSLISTTALHLFLSCFLPFSFERAESCAQPKTVMLAGFISKSRATFFATNRLLSERSDLFSYSAWFLIVWLTKLSIFFALIQVVFCWAQGWLAFVHNFHLKRFIFKLHVIKCESLNKTKV